eukprot:1157130-Pelagomonas_calceolata.AAC.4
MQDWGEGGRAGSLVWLHDAARCLLYRARSRWPCTVRSWLPACVCKCGGVPVYKGRGSACAHE